MNHIYNQGKFGACVAMAVCNAAEQQLGIVVPDNDIYDYFKKHFNEDVDGVRLPRLLQRMKVEPLGRVKVKSYECLYNSRWRDSLKKRLFMSKVRQSILKKDDSLVIVVKMRERKKGDQKIPLNKEGFLVPRKTKVAGYHAMLLARLAKSHMFSLRQFFIVEGSWGKDWGKSGCFYMTAEHIHSEAQSIYSVTFENAYS